MPKEESHRRVGSPIKATNGGRIAGYLVRFTDEEHKDLYETYFTRDTEFFFELGYPVKGDRILMEHGFTGAIKVMPVGIFDFAEVRDVGIWVEGMLHDRTKYKEYLQNLRESGKIDLSDEAINEKAALAELAVRSVVDTGETQWSSGTLDKRFKVSETGRILEWPIIEGTITVAPAEPNDTEVVSAMRSFGDLVDLFSNRSKVLGGLEESEEVQADGQLNLVKRKLAMALNLSRIKKKIPRVLRQIMPDNTEEEIAAVITLVAEEMGEAVSEEDVAEIVADVEEVIVEDIEESDADSPDSTMGLHEDDDEEDDERRSKQKATRHQAVVLKAVADAAVRRYAKRQANKTSRRSRVTRRALETHHRQDLEPEEDTVPVSSYRHSSRTPRITDVENLRYAHLSGMDMATYYLQMRALLPIPLRGQMCPVSNDFVKHMAHKIEDEAIRTPFKDPKDSAALRSVMPYKADEIDATTITGQGSEWVGVFQGTRLWEKVREESNVFQMMSSRGMFMQEIPQGHGSVKIPLEGADPIAYSSPQATDLDASGRVEVTAGVGFIGTANATLTPGTIKIAAATSDELEEDSIIPVLPQMTRQMEEKAVETLEQSLINGDTETAASTNINLIDGTPATGTSRPYYLVVNGLRKYPLVTNSGVSRSAGGALTIDDYRLTISKFSSKVRNRLDRLFLLIDSDTHNSSLALPEIATDDVRRTNATITSGRLVNIYGADVITSGFLLLSNNAGKNPVAAGTLGQIIGVYPPFWAFGWKRQTVTKTQEDILSGVVYVVTSMRFGFLPRGVDAATETYNVGVNV